MQLRPYQLRGVEGLRQLIAQRQRRVICHAPTGAGKTVIAAHLIERAVDKGKRVLFLAATRELIKPQCSGKLDNFGVSHGIIMAGEPPSPWHKVQLASKDTLHARGVRSSKVEMPPADLVIVDECHQSLAKGWKQILDCYPNAVIVGLTATPARGDGRGLGEIYQGMVTVATYEELIDSGALVPTRVYAPVQPDLKGVPIKQGDYDKRALEGRMNQAKLVGDIYEHWKRLASGRLTVVFASGVNHSMNIVAEFLSHGVKAVHIDGDTPKDEREAIDNGIRDGHYQIVSNCGVFTTGWDCPPISCAVLARPTKSIVLYRQMSGRVQRPWEGKTDCLVIDHAGAVFMHGFPDSDDIPWSLDGKEKLQDRIKERDKGKKKEIVACVNCGVLRSKGPKCSYCGFSAPIKGKEVEWEDGQLEEVSKSTSPKKPKRLGETKEQIWKRCVGICFGKNLPIKCAAGMYKGETGVWPAGFPNMPHGKEQWQMPAKEFYTEFIAPEKARA